MNAFRLLPIAVFTLIAIAGPGCEQSPRPYERGDTDYQKGKMSVSQPNIRTRPDRSVEGIRVAGPDTDLDPEYWDRMLTLRGKLPTFELFEQRYKDLQVYQADAAEAALRSFENFAARRGLNADFQSFWRGK